MTVPAEVIHERYGLGDRKNGSTASEVWVSDTAENQRIHSCQFAVEIVEEAGAVRELEHAPRSRWRTGPHGQLRHHRLAGSRTSCRSLEDTR